MFTTSELHDIAARCYDCDWTADRNNAQAIGAIHARAHGHKVTVMLTRSITYAGRSVR